MKKLLSILFIALSPISFVKEKCEKYTYRVPSTIQGMQYGVYEDEECKHPIKDKDNEDLIFTVDLNQQQDYSFENEHIYIQQVETIPGYYLDTSIYDISKENVYKVYPINIYYESDIYPAEYELFQGDERIANWKADCKSNAVKDGEKVIYEAGETYTIHQIHMEEYTCIEDVTFTIPKFMNENDYSATRIYLNRKEFSICEVEIKNEVDGIENVEYQLFIDEACTQEATDIYGQSTLQKTDHDGKIQYAMEEGTYYLKEMDISEDYYKDESIETVQLKNGETKSILRNPKFIQIKVLLIDGENSTPLLGNISYGDEKILSGEIVHLKRGETYEFQEVGNILGYFKAEPLSWKVSDTEEINEIELKKYPFTVTFHVYDIDTNDSIKGGFYRIMSQDVNVFSYRAVEDEYQTRSLQCGQTYTLEETKSPSMYCGNARVTFTIPEYSSSSQQISIEMYKIPYVKVSGIICNDNDEEIPAKMFLYQDEQCTKLINDIHGNQVKDITKNTYEIRNGTYYAKIRDVDSHYYEDTEVLKVSFDHKDLLDKVVSRKVTSISIPVVIQDENENILRDCSYDILDENKKIISSNRSDTEVRGLLERGGSYYLQINQIHGNYTYPKYSSKITIPTQLKDDLAFQMTCVAYITLNIKQQEIFGNVLALYTDETCMNLAKDIHGKQTKAQTLENDALSWKLRKGTYYLKEVETKKNCYPSTQLERIILDTNEWNVTKEFVSNYASINILIQDENGVSLQDGKYEIKNEEDTTITTFQGSQLNFMHENLVPSQTYTVHEVKAPNGYKNNTMDIVFTLPAQKPISNPEIEIQYKVEESLIPQFTNKELNPKENTTETNSSYIPHVAMGIGLLCIFIIFTKKYRNKHKTI